MLTLKYIRDNTVIVQESISRKQSDIDINQLLDLDTKRREYLIKVEGLRAEKNSVSNTIEEERFLYWISGPPTCQNDC